MTSDLRDLGILIPIRVSMKRHTEFVQEFGDSEAFNGKDYRGV